MRFPRIDIVFVYRRLLYINIYIRLRLRFVRSLSRVAARLFLDPLPIDR